VLLRHLHLEHDFIVTHSALLREIGHEGQPKSNVAARQVDLSRQNKRAVRTTRR